MSGSSACHSQRGAAFWMRTQLREVAIRTSTKVLLHTLHTSSSVSNQNNKSRLTLLALREELLEESFDDARQSLKSVVDDEKKYEVVLKSLILQVRAPGRWRTRPTEHGR